MALKGVAGIGRGLTSTSGSPSSPRVSRMGRLDRGTADFSGTKGSAFLFDREYADVNCHIPIRG